MPEGLLDGLSSLEHICLDNNRLRTLPENFFGHKNGVPLLHVWLQNNPIECLPSTILDHPYLTFLPSRNTFKVCGAASTVTLELSAPRISENGGFTRVTATMNHTSSAATTVTISASVQLPASASASDYRLSENKILTIPAGQTSSTGTVTITAVDNDIYGPPEKWITVSGTRSGDADNPADVLLTIEDDDNPMVHLVLDRTSIEEAGGVAEVTAELDAISEEETTVSLSFSPSPSPLVYRLDGDRTLTIAAGEQTSTDRVTITAVDNDVVSPDQTITIGGFARNTRGVTDPAAVVLTITDDDLASLRAPASVVVSEGSSEGLPVVLSSQPTAPVTVTVTGHATTDLTLNPVALIFTPTNWNVAQNVILTAAEDEGFTNDQVALTLTASGGGYVGVTHLVAVTITDNDVAAITAPASAIVPEGGTKDLPVALSSQPTGTVTVTVTGHAGTDLTMNPVALTFTSTNWNAEQRIVLTAAEDEDLTDDVVGLTLTASGGGYTGVRHAVAVTITDNGLAPLSVSIHDLTRREDAKAAQLRVELNRPSDKVVMVQYATSDGTAEAPSDYVSSQGFVVFGRNATKGVISVGIVDDAVAEGEEQLTVTLSKPRNAIIQRAVGMLTIVDDDGGVTLRVEDGVESAEVIRFTVHLSAPSSEPVSVSYRTRDGTAKAGEDYRAVAGMLEFLPGAVAATIAVPLLRDDLDWRGETFSVHLEQSTHAQIANAVAVATIREAGSVTRNVLAAYTARFVRTSSVHVVEALQERVQSRVDASVCAAGDRADLMRLWQTVSNWRPSLGELLGGCHVSRSTGGFGVWGRGAYRRFRGRDAGALRLRGSVATGLFGMDYRWSGRWMAGLVVAHSQGNGSFVVHQDTGVLESGLTGVYPYVSYQHQRGGIWVSGGYGRGRAEGVDLSGRLTSGFGALGVRGSLVSVQALRLSYHGDVWYADATMSDLDVTAEVYQTRLGMELALDLGDRIRPYVEANVRRDGGSAETGLGMELGGGVRVSVPAWHLKGEVRSQGLVLHAEDGFTQWGISGSVQVGREAEGLMLRVRPSWGANQGLTLHHQQTVLDAVPQRNLHRTEMEVGYGIPMQQGTARSVLGATWQSGTALMRLGGELQPRDRFTVAIYGLVHAHAKGNVGLNLRGTLQY